MDAYVFYAVTLVLSLGAPAATQTRPDFSGVWSVSAIRPAPKPSGGAALPPSDLTIRQTSTELLISRTAFDLVRTLTYDLAGRESTNKSGAVTYITHAKWEGARLVIEGKASQITSQGYSAWKLREIYSFDAKRRLLIDREYTYDDGTVIKSVTELVKK
jgi:hypothetical protein